LIPPDSLSSANPGRLMLVLGSGVIASCLLLSTLFAWGIYLDLNLKSRPCPPAPPVKSLGV